MSGTGHTFPAIEMKPKIKAVSGTEHTSGDSMEPVTVSGTRHKKKRDWKAINAKRPAAIGAKAMGVSRHAVEQVRRLHRFAGDEFDDRIKSGELTVAQAFQILKERTLEGFDEDRREEIKLGIAYNKIREHWTCMLAAARQAGLPEDRIRGFIAGVIKDVDG